MRVNPGRRVRQEEQSPPAGSFAHRLAIAMRKATEERSRTTVLPPIIGVDNSKSTLKHKLPQ
jgi:hypothetical protein